MFVGGNDQLECFLDQRFVEQKIQLRHSHLISILDQHVVAHNIQLWNLRPT